MLLLCCRIWRCESHSEEEKYTYIIQNRYSTIKHQDILACLALDNTIYYAMIAGNVNSHVRKNSNIAALPTEHIPR